MSALEARDGVFDLDDTAAKHTYDVGYKKWERFDEASAKCEVTESSSHSVVDFSLPMFETLEPGQKKGVDAILKLTDTQVDALPETSKETVRQYRQMYRDQRATKKAKKKKTTAQQEKNKNPEETDEEKKETKKANAFVYRDIDPDAARRWAEIERKEAEDRHHKSQTEARERGERVDAVRLERSDVAVADVIEKSTTRAQKKTTKGQKQDRKDQVRALRELTRKKNALDDLLPPS
eukprot:CAMPEP_0118907926 /NCGR_PEP_ID=MMETSP1166-20130328/11160_1 /TAXON_ID=1104430 /ORGANISM="Chrysoreinhardia sp, Strain CCMP3193" /LENGTH=235 /DNA_ID=CAMNT_0006847305 /DNA_START=12 /DNA_END=716 /DNA_ORIENTATION=+